MPSHSKNIWRPYTQEHSAQPAIPVDHAKGAYLYTKDGRKIFDGVSSWWLIAHGHCCEEIAGAVAEQARRIDQVLFANFTHDVAEELAKLLVEITPKELTKVFFTDNGSTAVESALKMCIQACQQKGQSKKKKILTFSKAYHGDTVGAMSVSERGYFTHPYNPFLFDVIHADQPTLSRAPLEEFTRDFQQKLQAHQEEIAAVIIEPLLQGAGGMITWPKEAVQTIARLCKQHGVYLIFDEVMTGFGRTGSLFAMDQLDVVPDLVCLSKGLTGGTLPLAVTLASDEIYQAFLSDDKAKMFFHGHSFTGNPISCAAAVASIKKFIKDKTVQKLSVIEQIHREQLERLAHTLPLLDRRVCGTMGAIEIDMDGGQYVSDFAEKLMEHTLPSGVFLRPLGRVIYLLPPFCSTPDDLRQAWSIIEASVQKLL